MQIILIDANNSDKCNICSRYCIYHFKCELIECSQPIRFFIVSLMYNNMVYYTSQLKCVFQLDENVSRGEDQTPHWGKQQLELSTRTWSGRATWNRGKFVSQPAPSRRQANDFFAYFSICELGGITKHFMTSPVWNSEFCFPWTSMLRVWGKQNSLLYS